MKPFLLADSYFHTLSKWLIFILLDFSFRVLQENIYNMIQQWLLKIGNEINNGNIELQRHVCTRRDLWGYILPWLGVLFGEKPGHAYSIEAGSWEGKIGTCII